MLRLVEPPLGEDALETPSREDVMALWAQALHQPIPAYSELVVHAFLKAWGGRRASRR